MLVVGTLGIRAITPGGAPAPPGPNVTISSFDVKTGSSATTHNLFGVPAGALIVVTTCNEQSATNGSVSSSPSLTWTKAVDASGTPGGNAEIYTAVFTAGGTINITSDWSTTYQSSVAYVITNHEVTPAGATGTGVTQTVPSVAITTTRANSLILCVSSNWNAVDGGTTGQLITYRGTPTQTHYVRDVVHATFVHYYYTAPTSQLYTVGWTAPDDGDHGTGTAVLEIRGT